MPSTPKPSSTRTPSATRLTPRGAASTAGSRRFEPRCTVPSPSSAATPTPPPTMPLSHPPAPTSPSTAMPMRSPASRRQSPHESSDEAAFPAGFP